MADNAYENTVEKKTSVAGLFKSTQEPINRVVAQSAAAATYLVPLNTHVNITYTQNYEDNGWMSLQQISQESRSRVNAEALLWEGHCCTVGFAWVPQSGQGCKAEGDGQSCHCLLSIQTAVLGKQLSKSRSTTHIKRFLLWPLWVPTMLTYMLHYAVLAVPIWGSIYSLAEGNMTLQKVIKQVLM